MNVDKQLPGQPRVACETGDAKSAMDTEFKTYQILEHLLSHILLGNNKLCNASPECGLSTETLYSIEVTTFLKLGLETR